MPDAPRLDDATIAERALDLVNKASAVVDSLVAKAAPVVASTEPPATVTVQPEPAPAPSRPTAAEVAKRRPQQAEPKVEATRAELVTIVASGDRAPLPDAIEVFSRSFDNIGGNKTGREYVLGIDTEGLHKLTRDGAEENRELLSRAFIETQNARREERAITAAFCAPPEPQYDLFTSVSSQNAGAVSLPELEAPRGAVKVAPAPSVFSLTGDTGIGVAWDGASSKTCFSFDCEDALDFSTTATYTCYSLPNGVLAFYPERVEAILRESRAAHAGSVNGQLITDIENAAVSYGAVGSGGGATVRVYQNLALFANWLRQKYQAPLDTFVDVLAPAWVAGVLEADLIARGSVTDPGYGLARWLASVRRLGVAMQFVYNYQEDLSSPAAPPTANMLMFFSGSVQRLRGRTLDIGPIHDTTTNATNRGGFFFETWDGIATSGPEIVELVNVATCPTGEVAGTDEIVCEGS